MPDKKLLVIDNHELFWAFREQVEEVGSLLGYQVYQCRSLHDASYQLMHQPYDLAIVDPTLLTAFSIKDSSTPLVAISLFDEPGECGKLFHRGYKGVIARFYNREEIAFVINSISNHRILSRRMHPRIVANLFGQLELESESLVGEMISLSQGGAFLRSFRLPEEARSRRKVYPVKFRLPVTEEKIEKPLIECKAQIVYAKPYVLGTTQLWPGMGLSFTDLDDKDKETLSTFIQYRLH